MTVFDGFYAGGGEVICSHGTVAMEGRGRVLGCGGDNGWKCDF